jgi:hypothetical protein
MPAQFDSMEAWKAAERDVASASRSYLAALENRHVVEPVMLQALADLLQARLALAHRLYIAAMQDMNMAARRARRVDRRTACDLPLPAGIPDTTHDDRTLPPPSANASATTGRP